MYEEMDLEKKDKKKRKKTKRTEEQEEAGEKPLEASVMKAALTTSRRQGAILM